MCCGLCHHYKAHRSIMRGAVAVPYVHRPEAGIPLRQNWSGRPDPAHSGTSYPVDQSPRAVKIHNQDLSKGISRSSSEQPSKNVVHNLEREETRVKIDGWQLHHLSFLDDIGLITPNFGQVERMLPDFDRVYRRFELQLNIPKTMLMRSGWSSSILAEGSKRLRMFKRRGRVSRSRRQHGQRPSAKAGRKETSGCDGLTSSWKPKSQSNVQRSSYSMSRDDRGSAGTVWRQGQMETLLATIRAVRAGD